VIAAPAGRTWPWVTFALLALAKLVEAPDDQRVRSQSSALMARAGLRMTRPFQLSRPVVAQAARHARAVLRAFERGPEQPAEPGERTLEEQPHVGGLCKAAARPQSPATPTRIPASVRRCERSGPHAHDMGADARPFRYKWVQTHGRLDPPDVAHDRHHGGARGILLAVQTTLAVSDEPKQRLVLASPLRAGAPRHERCSADGMTERNIRSRLFGVNVPRSERIATAVAGAAAIAFGLHRGLARRSIASALLAAAGAAAVARATTGRCPGYRARALRKGIQIRRAVTVQSTRREVYEVWRDLTNLPRFMKHVSQITLERGGISQWVAQVGHHRLTWRVELVEDLSERRLRWRSLPGGDLRHEGTLDLRDAPDDRGTTVEIKLHWLPPGGRFIAAPFHALLHRLVSFELGQDLARFQQLIETGEITTGARRIDESPESAPAARPAAAPPPPPPVFTAETSRWTNGTPGGAR
jgi:uncharacterized membrane protein